jgi:L-aspartate oxidase
LELIYLEHEELYKQSRITVPLCELRNMINVAYLIIKHARAQRQNKGLHYNIDLR